MLLVNLSVIIFQWVKTHLGKSTFWGLFRVFRICAEKVEQLKHQMEKEGSQQLQ